jgi:hypothetical protein
MAGQQTGSAVARILLKNWAKSVQSMKNFNRDRRQPSPTALFALLLLAWATTSMAQISKIIPPRTVDLMAA